MMHTSHDWFRAPGSLLLIERITNNKNGERWSKLKVKTKNELTLKIRNTRGDVF